MSESITHTAVTDDLARLARHSPEITGAFKECFARHLDTARLGGMTRSGDNHTPRLLAKFRDEWPGDDLLAQKLAFVLGWLCHRAADRQMKPVFRATDSACAHDPTDCSVYHDVFLFREVYGSGRESPYVPASLEVGMASHPAARAVDVDQVEDLFRAMWQRALVAMHTFIPDQTDVDGWLERVFKTRQGFYVDLRRYAEALARPDPDKVRRFLTDVNFYDREDALVRLARSLQRGEPDAGIDLGAALDAAETGSQYAQALRKGYLYLQAASAYFERRLDAAELRERLDIGKPGG